jgi:hypothetical protein
MFEQGTKLELPDWASLRNVVEQAVCQVVQVLCNKDFFCLEEPEKVN